MSLVTTEDRGAVRHVVLNRPEKRNAMNQALLVELGEALRAAADDAAVHCVVLRGEGPVFSAGVDLGELMSFAGDPGVLRPFRNVFLDCANLCEAMPKPVVCQIHRACFGGALEVALGCDLRIASERRPARPARGQVRDHPRRRRLLAPARGRRPRPREGADHDRRHDRRRRGAPHRPRQPRRPGRGAGGGHAGAGRRAARELPRGRRPRQARDRRLRPPRARTDAGAGGRGSGVLRRGDARERARGRAGAGG